MKFADRVRLAQARRRWSASFIGRVVTMRAVMLDVDDMPTPTTDDDWQTPPTAHIPVALAGTEDAEWALTEEERAL